MELNIKFYPLNSIICTSNCYICYKSFEVKNENEILYCSERCKNEYDIIENDTLLDILYLDDDIVVPNKYKKYLPNDIIKEYIDDDICDDDMYDDDLFEKMNISKNTKEEIRMGEYDYDHDYDHDYEHDNDLSDYF